MSVNDINCEVTNTGEENSTLHAMFFRCSNILHRRVGRRASRQRVLKILLEHGAITQGELRRLLGVQAGSFSELAANMEKHGLIKREKDAKDRRRMILRLTEQGEEIARLPVGIGDAELFHALCPDEQRQLRVMLQKIIDAHLAWKRRTEQK